MNERLVRLLLDNFWRLLGGALGFGLGILWACFGFQNTVVILALAVLGYLLGKWRDDGGPGPGLGRDLR